MTNIELKEIRKQLELKQTEMAELLQCSLRMYQYYESGEQKIPAMTAWFVKYVKNKVI
jgi:DNA-binding transcriptional regulator YiaG